MNELSSNTPVEKIEPQTPNQSGKTTTRRNASMVLAVMAAICCFSMNQANANDNPNQHEIRNQPSAVSQADKTA